MVGYLLINVAFLIFPLLHMKTLGRQNVFCFVSLYYCLRGYDLFHSIDISKASVQICVNIFIFSV